MRVPGMLCLAGLLAGITILISPFVINGGILFWVSDGTKQSDATWGLIGVLTLVTLGIALMLGTGVLAIATLVGFSVRGIRFRSDVRNLGTSISPNNDMETNPNSAANDETQN